LTDLLKPVCPVLMSTHVNNALKYKTLYLSKYHPCVGNELQFHPDSAWNRSSNLHETYQCRIYSRKLLMMGREDARNM